MDLEKFNCQLNEAIEQLKLNKKIDFTFVDKNSQRNKLKLSDLFDLCCKIFSQALNVLYNIQSNGYWYCFCIKCDGCPVGRFNSETINCTICKIDYNFDTYSLEKTKYKPKELFSYVSKLINKLKEVVSFDKSVSNFWCDEYKFKWRDD